MSNNDIIHNSDDDLGDLDLGDFDFTPDEDLLGVDSGRLVATQHSNFSEKPPRTSTSSTQEMCVIRHDAPELRDGPTIFPTSGMEWASNLQGAKGLPNPNVSRTSDPPNRAYMSSAPPNLFDNNLESPRRLSEQTSDISHFDLRGGPTISPTSGMEWASNLQGAKGLPNVSRTSDLPNRAFMSSAPPNLFDNNLESSRRSSEQTSDISHFDSRPNQMRMCYVCQVRPRYQRGGKFYPTCGLSCAAKLHAPGSVEMCDYCKTRPKIVIYGKMYSQCGKTCRDKAKLAETAANAAVCTSCILCWKSTKNGESDFCSEACQNLADIRAPFLIEIPRGHVAFKKVAERFTSDWQTSKTHCPTIKRVYMVVVKKSFKTSFEKYLAKIGSHGILHRKRTPKLRWLVFSRECGFGDPGDLEPCSSNKCLLCSILRTSFNRSDFPGGIRTSGLDRTVELNRGGKKSSSKIAALTQVVVGREAEMSPREMQVVHPLPPQNTDSVHVIGVRKDGSRVDMGDIIVYDRNAVQPIYLISYE